MADFNSTLTGQQIENTLLLSAARNPDVVIPFGDSNSVRMWTGRFSLTGAITVSGGIATITFTGTHNIPDGTRFRMAGSSFAGYNTVHTTISAPSSISTTFIAPTGAPTSETIAGQSVNMQHLLGDTTGWVNALQTFSKQRFDFPYSANVAGNRTQDALLRIDEVLNELPGRVIVMLGTNDATEATSEDTDASFSNLTQICETFLKNGIAVDLCTILPFGTGYVDVASPVKVTFLLDLNRRIRKYAQITRGVRLHDIHEWISDPTQVDARAKPGLLGSDGLHLELIDRVTGSWIIGQNMAANYVKWLGEPDLRLVTSQAESETFNALSKNIISNPLMIDSGATGLADGWTASTFGGGNSHVATIVARTVVDDGDDFGFNQVLTYSGTSDLAATFFQTVSFTPDKKYIARAVCDIALGGVPGQLECTIRINFTVDGFLRRQEAKVTYVNTDDIYYLETAAFIVPTGASAVGIDFRLATVTTGNPIFKWGRISLIEID